MSVDKVLEEPEDIEKSSPRVDGTLEVHKIARCFSTDDVCKLEFFKRAVDEQYYKKDGYPDVCGHAELTLCYNPDQTCAECHGIHAKDRSSWSVIFVISGFMKNVFSFRFFWSTVSKQFLLDLDDSRTFMQFLKKFLIASWRTDKFLNSHLN